MKTFVKLFHGMGKIIFIIGGIRSGKSGYAVKLAKKINKNVTVIATCINPDDEMKKRIEIHKKSRPRHWKTMEEGEKIIPVLNKLKDKYGTIIIDCLGLWISNLLAKNLTDEQIKKNIDNLIKVISNPKADIIFVSNEVGCGIIPDNILARRFIDLLGLLNQKIATVSNKVIFMNTGIPITIKNQENEYNHRDTETQRKKRVCKI